MHFRGRALEKPATSCISLVWTQSAHAVAKLTSDKQSITGEDNLVVSILHEVADTVLCVAGRVQRLNGDALSDLEDFAVCRGPGDRLAILAADDRELAEGF